MLEGEEVPEPEKHDDLMVHYEVFFKAIQEYSFKIRVSPERKQNIFMRIKVIEGLLWSLSKTNMKLMSELQMIRHFPSFFQPPQLDPAMVAQGADVAGSNVGQAPTLDTAEMKNTNEAIESERKKEENP